ncbi:hypothetical protein F5890DRAFT_1649131 [Lentinula detonsa]|uniref:Uncharacterized protein n=1 Tax=Lentinula detonsa TaxID=2804962 RepID=A0AA38Q1S5_9AGAR|nr:hypothetical protein F5890DRAFT_1649131 [Lentinula detonsa]
MFLSPTTSRPLTCIYQFHSKSSDWSSRKMSFPSRIRVFGKRHDRQKKTAPTGVDNTVAASLGKNRHPRKDEYKHTRLPRKEGSGVATQKTRAPRKGRQTGIKHTNGFLARKGLGVTMRQTQRHGLLARSGKRALSAVGITAARDTQLIGRTGAHNLLKYWGPERFGNDRTSERRVGGMSSLCSTREQGGKKGRNPLSFRVYIQSI